MKWLYWFVFLICLTAIALWLVAERAFAYRPGGQNSTIFVTTAVTVGTASAQAIGPDASRSFIQMCNMSAAATVAWSTLTNGAAALNTAGSLPLAAGACQIYDNTKFTDGINMIASAASTPVTILTVD